MKRTRIIIAFAVCTSVLVVAGIAKLRPVPDRGVPVTQAEVRMLIAERRTVIAKEPGRTASHEYLATWLSILGSDEAVTELRKAAVLYPRQPAYHCELGRVYQRMGKDADALREMVSAAELGRGPLDYKGSVALYSLSAAEMLRVAGRLEEAERYYEMMLAQLQAYGWDAEGHPYVDSEDDLRDKADDGLALVKGRLAHDRPSQRWLVAHIPYLSHDASHGRNREKDLVDALAKTLTAPNEHFGWFKLGWAYMWQGRLDAAADAFDRAHSLGDEGAEITARDVRSASRAFEKESGKK